MAFSRGDIPAIRQATQRGVKKQVLNRIKHDCERLIDPADENYLDYRECEKPMWRERNGIFFIMPAMLTLSFGYAFTGDRRFGEAARDTMLKIIQTRAGDLQAVAYGEPTSGWRRGRGHDKHNYAWMMSSAYDLCYDLLSDDERQSFIDHALESIKIILEDAPETFQGDIAQQINNRGSRGIMAVCGIYPLVLEGDVDLPKMDKYLDYTIAAVEAYMHVAIGQDGACFEGPSYGNVINNMYYMCRALARSGRINLLKSKRWEQYIDYLVYEMLPGGYTMNDLNDCKSPSGSVAPVLFLIGTEKGAVVPWLAHQLDLHPRRIEADESSQFNRFYGSASPLFLLDWQEDAPVQSPEELGYPLSHLFAHRGIASMRSGWGEQDTLLSHRCGMEIFRLHKQSDQNHIALYALGEKFLVDEGYGQSDITTADNGTTALNRYFSQSDVHNTVQVDGRSQNGNQITVGWAEGKFLDWRHTPAFDTSLGEAGGAYGPDHTIDHARRRVVYVREATQPFIIVVDTLCVGDGESHDYEVLWRTARDNSIAVDGDSFLIIGQQNDCYGEVVFPESKSLEVRTHYNLPQLRVINSGEELQMVTVLVPVQRGAAPPSFTCKADGGGQFTVNVTDGSQMHTVRAGTKTRAPVNIPVPVEHEVCDI